MEKALKNLSLLLKERQWEVEFWRKCLEGIREMPRAHRIFRRITRAPDIEQLYDTLAEVKYALIFVGLGFNVEIEPKGNKGPDLGISRENHTAVVEVKRFRQVNEVPTINDLPTINGERIIPGVPDFKDAPKIYNEVWGKFSQVDNEEAVIALWSDDVDIYQRPVKCAAAWLHYEATEGIRSIPPKLSFVIFGSKWIGGSKWLENNQFHCILLQSPGDLRLASWLKKIEHFHDSELIQRALEKSSQETAASQLEISPKADS